MAATTEETGRGTVAARPPRKFRVQTHRRSCFAAHACYTGRAASVAAWHKGNFYMHIDVSFCSSFFYFLFIVGPYLLSLPSQIDTDLRAARMGAHTKSRRTTLPYAFLSCRSCFLPLISVSMLFLFCLGLLYLSLASLLHLSVWIKEDT